MSTNKKSPSVFNYAHNRESPSIEMLKFNKLEKPVHVQPDGSDEAFL